MVVGSTSRRYLSRTAIGSASSSSPRNQSAELSSASSSPAKKSPNRAALSNWGNSWKPETDMSAIRGNSAIRLTPGQKPSRHSSRGNRNIEGRTLTSFDFLDDFTSSAVTGESESTEEDSDSKDLRAEEYNDEIDESEGFVPAHMQGRFPTRARPGVAGGYNGLDADSDVMIPWEDAAGVEKRMYDSEDPDAAAWRDLSTPELWARAKKRKMVRPDSLPSGTKLSRRLALESPQGELKWMPDQRLDGGRTTEAAAGQKRTPAPDSPTWKTQLQAVKGKTGGGPWKPFPAAVAAIKQLKVDNPGMTVEEYAPYFKISPESLRRILKSKWTPTGKEAEDRLERWQRRGDAIWAGWEKLGLVVTRESKRIAKEKRNAEVQKSATARGAPHAKQGFILRQKLNLKNRIL
ncbi:hypothetical protein DRE_00001 [Drechslerella stenobrocha 248]|uniref:Required for respiratory growth protein 9, mitochondrial n=1 Tax=Drechslerella stenobrocha 248 TaxID=1043628 RepID=W7HWZ5_9PEZI|nr:hypothetical protein DRE_00001 [Drechslerella stenobrocha 248]